MIDDIKDIKPPLDIPSQWTWAWYVLGGIVVVAFVVAIVIFIIKKWPKKVETVEFPSRPAWEKAHIRLDNLRLKNLIDRKDLKPFYTELSGIIRYYLEERFSIKAPEMTTEEFLESLRKSPFLNENQQHMLKDFLYACDMVKFAQHESSVSEAQKSFDLVQQLVSQTHGV